MFLKYNEKRNILKKYMKRKNEVIFQNRLDNY